MFAVMSLSIARETNAGTGAGRGKDNSTDEPRAERDLRMRGAEFHGGIPYDTPESTERLSAKQIRMCTM
jgi:hypothetical protein